MSRPPLLCQEGNAAPNSFTPRSTAPTRAPSCVLQQPRKTEGNRAGFTSPHSTHDRRPKSRENLQNSGLRGGGVRGPQSERRAGQTRFNHWPFGCWEEHIASPFRRTGHADERGGGLSKPEYF